MTKISLAFMVRHLLLKVLVKELFNPVLGLNSDIAYNFENNYFQEQGRRKDICMWIKKEITLLKLNSLSKLNLKSLTSIFSPCHPSIYFTLFNVWGF